MKIGFVQFSPVLGDPEATIRRIDALLEGAESADLLVLPELCNSGYNFRSLDQARALSEETGDSAFVRFLQSKCRGLNLHIASGFNERDGDRLYNTAVLVGPEGFVGKYRKLHLFMKEKTWFTPGDLGLPVFDIGRCRLGLLVCFDWIFPEVWRILAMKGADIICHPSNLVLPGLAQSAVPVHALTNRVYVVTANRIGTEDDLTFTGLSTIADTRGKVLLQAGREGEKTGIMDIDPSLARDKMITPRNHVFEDRRPEAYRLLTKDDNKCPSSNSPVSA